MTKSPHQSLLIDGANLVALHDAILRQSALTFRDADVDRILPRYIFGARYRGDDHDRRESVAHVVLDYYARANLVGLTTNNGIQVDLDDSTSDALSWHPLEEFRVDVGKIFRRLARLGSVRDVAFGEFLFQFVSSQLV